MGLRLREAKPEIVATISRLKQCENRSRRVLLGLAIIIIKKNSRIHCIQYPFLLRASFPELRKKHRLQNHRPEFRLSLHNGEGQGSSFPTSVKLPSSSVAASEAPLRKTNAAASRAQAWCRKANQYASSMTRRKLTALAEMRFSQSRQFGEAALAKYALW